MLKVIGLGVNAGDISLGALKAVKNSDFIILRTDKTRSAAVLKDEGIKYISLDFLYEKSRNFETLKKNVVKEVKEYLKKGEVCYLVDGAVSEDLCAAELIKSVKEVQIFEGSSKTGQAVAAFSLSGGGYTAVSAYDISKLSAFSFPLVVYDLDSAFLASEWKIKLSKIYGEEKEVGLYVDNRKVLMPVYELDHNEKLFNYSTVLIAFDCDFKEKERFSFEDLLEIVKVLRSENGCPWDKAQTMETIRKNLIEECYELVDAVNKDDDDKIIEETGDLLLQAAFYIQFEEERGIFDNTDVLSGICHKLVSRHTHIFGKDKATDPEAALEVWSKNKQAEKGMKTASEYVGDVPATLPAAMRASKTVKRGTESGLKFTKEEVKERVLALAEEVLSDKTKGGELLFDAITLVKLCGGDPEQDITDETELYIKRFLALEKKLEAEGKNIKTADEETVKKAYDEIKKS
ncbi:MAG TPA: hypothetical protein DDY77_04520 [Clostridiales bacterium]|nr:hypothetical protein [Clostridiales bacterium]